MGAVSDPEQKVSFCIHCGEYLPSDATQCPKCGRAIGGGPARGPAPRPSGFLASASVGGWLFILSGLDGILSTIYLFASVDQLIASLMTSGLYSYEEWRAAALAVIVLLGFCSIMSLMAGYFALKRRHFRLVALGGFFSLFTLGLFFFEGSFFGLLGLVAVFRSRREFH